ncbi:hypothetical protein PZB74_17475 [Porifericola rhodea]|uniref:hypothetical protein n=1 Tax=Porifericola rhodea TaxID=930972 RepID=UPI0026664B7E|nr:hypothetical protein [Porifericola rhodea]WKN30749.1 hypothetical protein PZB74_17475 [Porifericola rhodea]
MNYRAGMPDNSPNVIVSNTAHPLKSALILLGCTQLPLKFVKIYKDNVSPLKRFVLRFLNIEPLVISEDVRQRKRSLHKIWKSHRELLTHNYSLVFLTKADNGKRKLSKSPARLSFHTESVFDFNLNVKIFPVRFEEKDEYTTIVNFLNPVCIAKYAQEYKNYPAHTIRHITQQIEEVLYDYHPILNESVLNPSDCEKILV